MMRWVLFALLTICLVGCSRVVPKAGIRVDLRGEDLDGYIFRELDPTRDEWQKPKEVIDALRLDEGQAVADVGAGAGYFAVHLASAVGPDGKVYAADTDSMLLERLRARLEEKNIQNVLLIPGKPEDPKLPSRSVELALLCNTLSRVDLLYAFIENLKKGLKKEGRVAVIDFKQKQTPFGPPVKLRVKKKKIIAVMKASGFKLIEEHDFLPYQYFLVFTLEKRYG